MRKLISRMHGGQGGFTLIELLVVIAILGVIAAIVALNVAGFFGRGTLQAANTELRQAQTAIIAMMADAESNRVSVEYVSLGGDPEVFATGWAGEPDVVFIDRIPDGETQQNGVNYWDAADYVYGPFRGTYTVVAHAAGVPNPGAITSGLCDYPGGWGDGIAWNYCAGSWSTADDDDTCQDVP